MKKILRSILFFLSFCVIISSLLLFTGCKVGDSSNINTTIATDSTHEHSDVTSSETIEKPDSFTFMTRDSESPGTSYKTMTCIRQKALEELTGIKIIWDVIPNEEYKEVMELRLATKKDLPDFIEIQGDSSGAYLVRYFEDGIIRSLNKLIENYAPGFRKLLEEYPDYREALTLPDGNIVALGNVDASKYTASVILIRKDWLDKVALDAPKTMDELYDAAYTFQQADIDGNGKNDTIGISANDFWSYRQLGMGYGLHLTIGDGWAVKEDKVVYDYITPEFMEYLKWMHKCFEEDIFPSDMVNHTRDMHFARLTNGLVGIDARNSPICSWNNPEDSFQDAQPGAVWIPIAPSGPFGDAAVPKEPTASRWRTIAITTECKYPEAAMEYLDIVVNSEKGRLINKYGVEGITYKIINDKIVPIPDPVLEPGTFFGRNTFINIKLEEDDELTFEQEWFKAHPQYEYVLNSIKNVHSKVSTGFVPPIPPLDKAKKVNSIMADLKTARDEAVTKFIIGDMEITDETFTKYVKDLESIGVYEILEIYQEGYNKVKGINH